MAALSELRFPKKAIRQLLLVKDWGHEFPPGNEDFLLVVGDPAKTEISKIFSEDPNDWCDYNNWFAPALTVGDLISLRCVNWKGTGCVTTLYGHVDDLRKLKVDPTIAVGLEDLRLKGKILQADKFLGLGP